jgi:hypothetical protein
LASRPTCGRTVLYAAAIDQFRATRAWRPRTSASRAVSRLLPHVRGRLVAGRAPRRARALLVDQRDPAAEHEHEHVRSRRFRDIAAVDGRARSCRRPPRARRPRRRRRTRRSSTRSSSSPLGQGALHRPPRRSHHDSGFADFLNASQVLFCILIGYNGGNRVFKDYERMTIENFIIRLDPITKISVSGSSRTAAAKNRDTSTASSFADRLTSSGSAKFHTRERTVPSPPDIPPTQPDNYQTKGGITTIIRWLVAFCSVLVF